MYFYGLGYAVDQILCRIEKWVKYPMSMGVIVHFDPNKCNVAHPYTPGDGT